jgi:hypothetical protein
VLRKCANPDCDRPFRNLSEGKLFQIEIGGACGTGQLASRRNNQVSHRIEHFWLCQQCSSVLTLCFDQDRGITAVPLPKKVARSSMILFASQSEPTAERSPLKRA